MSATLRLFVTDASNDTGDLYATANTTWSETSTTWNNRPSTTGARMRPARPRGLGQWVEFDVTAVVTAAGNYSFTLTNAARTPRRSRAVRARTPRSWCSRSRTRHPPRALPNPPHVGLRLNHQFTTSPFAGTATSASGGGGTAYVAGDDAVWLVDGSKLYETDATTERRSAGSSRRPTSPTPCPSVRPGHPAGTTRSDSLAAVTYDRGADVLYVFSRNCCTATGLDPSVFRMVRDGSGVFQVESYQALPAGTDPVAAGVRPGAGLYFGKGQTVFPYDYTTNTIGTAIVIPGVDTALSGMDFTTDGNDLLVTSHLNVLYRVSTATWTVVPVVLRPHPATASSIPAASRSSATRSSSPTADSARWVTRCATPCSSSTSSTGPTHPITNFTVSPTSGTAPSRRRSSTAAPVSRARGSGTSVTARRPPTPARCTPTASRACTRSTLTVTNDKGTATRHADRRGQRGGQPAAPQRQVHVHDAEWRRAAAGPVHGRERRRRDRMGVGLR